LDDLISAQSHCTIIRAAELRNDSSLNWTGFELESAILEGKAQIHFSQVLVENEESVLSADFVVL
jgi:hypothetical protein